MLDDRIEMSHGTGGRASGRLVRELFLKHLGNPILNMLDDGAVISLSGKLAVSTDSFVVDPIFFPGGDIGKLAVCGTVNDVAMCGAMPQYLTAAFILEEGLVLSVLERVIRSMAKEAKNVGVKVVTGDTKVVPRGKGDKIFITTTGVGKILPGVKVGGRLAKPGNRVLLSGPVGDHGTTIMAVRAGIELGGTLKSDCASVASMAMALLRAVPSVRCLRDPTRGGLSAVLHEFAVASHVGMRLNESDIPVSAETRSACDILGLDPFNMACEGRMVAVVPAAKASMALKAIRKQPGGRLAADIGEVVKEHPGQVVIRTTVGGTRLLDMLEGEPLPRIC
jgi:hydrogenase expression/formation protein HypE